MANNTDKLKEIFDNMQYDDDAKEGYDLALAWVKQHEHIFKTKYTDIKPADLFVMINNEQIFIDQNIFNDDHIEKLLAKSEESLKEWTSVSGIRKAKLFNRLASEIERHTMLICQLEMSVRNILIKDTKNKDIPLLTDYLRYYSGWASSKNKNLSNYKSYGICGCDLSIFSSLPELGMVLAPALAAGNVLIINSDPGIMIPIILLLIQLAENVGFPKGIIQLKTGGFDSLIKNNAIKKFISLGHMLKEEYTNMMVTEQLNVTALHSGSTPMLVFENADLDSACESSIYAAWGHNLLGSVNKVFVQETIFDVFVEKLKFKISKLTVNCSANQKKTDLIKPFSNKNESDAIEVNSLQLIIGNKSAGTHILEEEDKYGLCIIPFRTANEGAALANNSIVGLFASVWTENINLANEIVSKLKMGTVWINCHGNISPSSTFCPMKKSGKGYFGGKEGLLEYLWYPNQIKFIEQEKKESKISSRLPGPINKRLYLYYGGSFKKSESGLTEDDMEYPNRKDVRNCVELAKKGQESWNKLSSKIRSQNLKKFADASAHTENDMTNMWIELLYEWSTIGCSTVSLNLGSPALTTVRVPLGVIVIELLYDSQFTCLKLIVSAISCGNSVIIINKSDEMQEFLNDICGVCNLPPAVFNIIFNPNDEVINTLKSHQEIDAYLKVINSNDEMSLSNMCKVHNIANVNTNSVESIVNFITKVKCIWSSVGESFL